MCRRTNCLANQSLETTITVSVLRCDLCQRESRRTSNYETSAGDEHGVVHAKEKVKEAKQECSYRRRSYKIDLHIIWRRREGKKKPNVSVTQSFDVNSN